MILRAIADWNVDPSHSLIVGDKPRDIEAGARAGVPGLLFAGGNLADAIRTSVALLARAPEGSAQPNSNLPG